MASYGDILTALDTLFAGLPGVQLVVRHPPTSVQVWPLVWNERVSWTQELTGQLVVRRYQFRHHILVPLQDPQAVAAILDPYVDAVLDAFQAQPTLGGLLQRGLARIIGGGPVEYSVGQVLCWSYDFMSEVMIK